jgi:tetratricopeptide (TPR) repeat protein
MRKLFLTLLCLCLVFVAAFAGYRGYKIWKQKHLVKLARAFLDKSDGANAILCLRQALHTNPNNLEACRMMADFADVARSPQAVVWRSRLVDLEPHSFTNRLALARTAMAVGDAALAQKTLDGADDASKKTAVYHKVAGAVDLSARRLPDAETHFSEAARLEPANPVSQLNLATLRLQKNDPQAPAEARAVLQALCTNQAVRCDALRQLTLDALRHTNLNGALAFSGQLLKDTNSIFRDRMVHLDILGASTNSQQQSFLASLQKEAASDPPKTYAVAKSMLSAGKAQAALAWLKSLPPATRTNLPVPMIEAECYMAAKDWATLQTSLGKQDWSDMDCLRLACRSRAFREQGMGASAKADWASAMKATGNRRELLVQFLNLTATWDWPQEHEDVLWAVASHYPKEKWAIRGLAERFYAAGRTRSLLTLFTLAAQNDPADPAAKNNLAMTAMLLESWEKKPHDLAREVYAKFPTNASFVSTYAYSLLVQQHAGEALKTMEQLSPQQLEVASISGYYGLILQASGNAAKARKYLDLASKATLLPEEKKLITQASKKI